MDAQHESTEALVTRRERGNPAALDRLVPLVYAELRAIAHRQLLRERPSHTLNTTALVHEAYLRLAGHAQTEWRDEAHLFAIASRVMRRVLVDYARRHRAAKRAGTHHRVPLEDAGEAPTSAPVLEATLAAADVRAEALVELDDALTRLATLDERLGRVVECRFFGGLTEEETAAALGVTARTVRRDWIKAKGWLRRALREAEQ